MGFATSCLRLQTYSGKVTGIWPAITQWIA